MIRLKGLTWDHPRATRPLAAAAGVIAQHLPTVVIDWSAQPLAAFEHGAITTSAAAYDLIIFDHPHVGEVAADELFLSLDAQSTKASLDASQFVGPSFQSYFYAGRRWGLPLDAAAQVACYRRDLLGPLGAGVPSGWEEMFRLAEQARQRGWHVAGALCGVHGLMSFLTLCGNLGRGIDSVEGLDQASGGEALTLLRRFARVAHPGSLEWNSIALQDAMRDRDDLVYCPLVYGFVPYARGARGVLRYVDIPGPDGEPVGSILGGAGIAVSSRSEYPELAAEVALLLVSGAVQREVIAAADGQPAHLEAWIDPTLNMQVGNFYRATRRTLDRSTVRPRFNGYMRFQREASTIIGTALRDSSASARSIVDLINERFALARDGGGE